MRLLVAWSSPSTPAILLMALFCFENVQANTTAMSLPKLQSPTRTVTGSFSFPSTAGQVVTPTTAGDNGHGELSHFHSTEQSAGFCNWLYQSGVDALLRSLTTVEILARSKKALRVYFQVFVLEARSTDEQLNSDDVSSGSFPPTREGESRCVPLLSRRVSVLMLSRSLAVKANRCLQQIREAESYFVCQSNCQTQNAYLPYERPKHRPDATLAISTTQSAKSNDSLTPGQERQGRDATSDLDNITRQTDSRGSSGTLDSAANVSTSSQLSGCQNASRVLVRVIRELPRVRFYGNGSLSILEQVNKTASELNSQASAAIALAKRASKMITACQGDEALRLNVAKPLRTLQDIARSLWKVAVAAKTVLDFEEGLLSMGVMVSRLKSTVAMQQLVTIEQSLANKEISSSSDNAEISYIASDLCAALELSRTGPISSSTEHPVACHALFRGRDIQALLTFVRKFAPQSCRDMVTIFKAVYGHLLINGSNSSEIFMTRRTHMACWRRRMCSLEHKMLCPQPYFVPGHFPDMHGLSFSPFHYYRKKVCWLFGRTAKESKTIEETMLYCRVSCSSQVVGLSKDELRVFLSLTRSTGLIFFLALFYAIYLLTFRRNWQRMGKLHNRPFLYLNFTSVSIQLMDMIALYLPKSYTWCQTDGSLVLDYAKNAPKLCVLVAAMHELAVFLDVFSLVYMAVMWHQMVNILLRVAPCREEDRECSTKEKLIVVAIFFIGLPALVAAAVFFMPNAQIHGYPLLYTCYRWESKLEIFTKSARYAISLVAISFSFLWGRRKLKQHIGDKENGLLASNVKTLQKLQRRHVIIVGGCAFFLILQLAPSVHEVMTGLYKKIVENFGRIQHCLLSPMCNQRCPMTSTALFERHLRQWFVGVAHSLRSTLTFGWVFFKETEHPVIIFKFKNAMASIHHHVFSKTMLLQQVQSTLHSSQ